MIALTLGGDASTISREVGRNGRVSGIGLLALNSVPTKRPSVRA